jgi:hypothetical protein
MKNKYLLYKLSGIVFLILAIILYFLLYFIPALKSINLYKRQLKDTNLQVADFVEAESNFTFSNQRERHFFTQAEQELKDKIPEVKTREDFIAIFTKISDYIQQCAQGDGIFNLVLKSDSPELSVNASTLSSDKKTLDDLLGFASRRLLELRKEQERLAGRQRGTGGSTATAPKTNSGLSSLVKDVKYQTITLSFSGELKNALNFINHIPWSEYYMSEDKILVSSGELLPYYIVFLKIYFIDHQGET